MPCACNFRADSEFELFEYNGSAFELHAFY